MLDCLADSSNFVLVRLSTKSQVVIYSKKYCIYKQVKLNGKELYRRAYKDSKG